VKNQPAKGGLQDRGLQAELAKLHTPAGEVFQLSNHAPFDAALEPRSAHHSEEQGSQNGQRSCGIEQPA
jgi:hypothetical protein